MQVARPSVFGVVVFALLSAMAVAITLQVSSVAGWIAVLVFDAFIVVAVGSLVLTRVVVDGVELRRRRLRWSEPIRIDRLVRAELSGWSRNRGPLLHLHDEAGRSMDLDATNFSLRRLWPILARTVAEQEERLPFRVAEGRLRRRLDRFAERETDWRPPAVRPPEPQRAFEPRRPFLGARPRLGWWVLPVLAVVVGGAGLIPPNSSDEVTGGTVLLAVGGVLLLLLRAFRVRVEGGELRARGLRGWSEPVDLGAQAEVRWEPGALGRTLVVGDRWGRCVRLSGLWRDLRFLEIELPREIDRA